MEISTLWKHKQLLSIALGMLILTIIFVPLRANAFTVTVDFPNEDTSITQSSLGEQFEVTIDVDSAELISVSSITLILDNGDTTMKRATFDSDGDYVSGSTNLLIDDLTVSPTSNTGYGYGFGLVSSGYSFSAPYSYSFTYGNAFVGGNNISYSSSSGGTNQVTGLIGPGEITISGTLRTVLLSAGSHDLQVLIDTGAGGNNADQLTAAPFVFTVSTNSEIVTTTVSTSSNAPPVDLSVGSSIVTIDFGVVSSAGRVLVDLVLASDLVEEEPDIFEEVFDAIATFNVGTEEAMTMGDIIDIDISELGVSGTFDVTIGYDPDLLPDGISEDDVKFFHWTGTEWEDVTLSVDTGANTVTGRLSSLSPVVAGVNTGSSGGSSNSGGGGGGGGRGGSSGGIALPEPVDLTTYPDSYFVLHPLAKIQVLALTFINAQGVGTSQITEGEQVGIATTFKNYQDHDQTYAYIVQIEDNDGRAIDMNFQTGKVSAAQTTISTAWTASESGVYTIKVFVWDSLGEAPMPLSEVGVTAINVVE